MAKKPSVKCLYCGESFYREDCEYVQVGRRYSHKKCHEKRSVEDKAKDEIHQRCKNMFGVNYSANKINKQINMMLKEGKTLININKTLVYWYDIKKNDPSKANNGINIVNWVYGEALEYFLHQKKIKARNEKIITANYEVETFTIKQSPIKKPLKVKLFDIQ